MIANAKRADASDEYVAVTSTPIADQITRELLPTTGRREVGRTISMHDTVLFHWGVTLSCASTGWTSIVWKGFAVIRKMEVAFSRKASTMTRRRERSLPKAQNPSNAQVQNWSFA